MDKKIDDTIIEISSVQDFLEFLQNFSGEFFFRGENNVYSDRISSAYRPFESDEGVEKYINYQLIFSEFYKEIGSMISHDEKENLLSYYQHHGIPTPLIDITSNPLVALYFATLKTNYEDVNDSGYIYVYDKNLIINISEFVNSELSLDFTDTLISMDNPKLLSHLINQFTKIIGYNETVFKEFYLSLIDSFSKTETIFKENYSWVYDDYQLYSELYSLMKAVTAYPDIDLMDLSRTFYFSNNLVETELKLFESEIRKIDTEYQNSFIEEKMKSSPAYHGASYSYTFILVHYLRLINRQWIIPQEGKLPLMPLFLYEPTHYFDRMQTQNGSFFYQIGIRTFNHETKQTSLLYQQFPTKYTLVIKNQKVIVEQLDSIHINRKTLFNDIDNIAQYVTEKYK